VVPAAVRSSFDGFLANGALGSGRASVRERLGLPEMPPSGLEGLRTVLARPEEKKS
jgi:hypothetical protein